MATYSNNTTIKIKGALTSGYTVAANEYAIATYLHASFGLQTVHFGVGQVAAATIGGGSWSFQFGVVFINTP